MAYILQIDTSGNTGTVALAENGKLTAKMVNNATRDHAAVMDKMIDAVLTKEKIGFKDINAVAVCAGPGSYTGLRIGLAIAKGICYAWDIPLILHNKLNLLANQEIKLTEKRYDRYIVVLKAREKEYFMGIHDKNMTEILSPVHLRHNICEENIIDQKGNLLIVTDVEDLEKDLLKSDLMFVKAAEPIDLECWSTLSFEDLFNNKITDMVRAEPFYLKEVFINK